MGLDNFSCDLGHKVKVKGRILYFLVNASPPKLLDVAISKFMSHDVDGNGPRLM